jgi:hypothetical protein
MSGLVKGGGSRSRSRLPDRIRRDCQLGQLSMPNMAFLVAAYVLKKMQINAPKTILQIP